MKLNEWFNRGITKEDYMDSLKKHRDAFLHIYNNFQIPESDKSFFRGKSHLYCLVLAEEWCGHCMLNIPILLHITDQAEMPIRFLPRDDNLELMDQYLTNEKRFIPIFIFTDEKGNELAKWGPMAPEISEYVAELKKDVPAKDSPGYDEAFRTYVEKTSETFRTNETFWNYVYEDIKKTLP